MSRLNPSRRGPPPGPRSVNPSKNSTLPVGTPPLPLVLVTVAVNVTESPYVELAGSVLTAVVVPS